MNSSSRCTGGAYRTLSAVALLCVSASTIAHAGTSTLDTLTSWNGIDQVGDFGVPAPSDINPPTQTFGQTFLAPSGVGTLDDFTFALTAPSSVHLKIKPVVFAWTGSLLGGGGGTATGSSLFTGSTISFDGTGSYQSLTAATGGIALTPGGKYVIAFTVSDPTDYAASSGFAQFGLNPMLSHASAPQSGGGGFVFNNNGNDFAGLGTVTWDNNDDFGDLAFKAHFTTMPDGGSSLALIGIGVAGLRVMSRRAARR